MAIPRWCNDTIIRIRPGTKTERGSEIPDWDDPDTLVINGCSVQPASTSLTQDGRIEGVADGLTVYAPAGADVQAGDRVEYAGNVYTINGDVLSWPSASGTLDHLHLNLMRWRG